MKKIVRKFSKSFLMYQYKKCYIPKKFIKDEYATKTVAMFDTRTYLKFI